MKENRPCPFLLQCYAENTSFDMLPQAVSETLTAAGSTGLWLKRPRLMLPHNFSQTMVIAYMMSLS